jgi:Brp/Blh family beta-carotene 15,15'-monooxygenase
MVAPVICLLAFLVISMLHFGMGDVRAGNGWQGMLEALAHGGLVVAGISHMHRKEVDMIFGYLVDGKTLLVWQGLEIIAIFVAVALLFCMVQGVINRRWRGGLAELVILGAIFAFTPPLVGFAIYFCLVHTPRHVRAILASVSSGVSRRLILSQVVLFSVASWFAGGLAFWLLLGAETAEAALMRVVFIGLAALTVPHMILVDGLFRRVQPSLRRQFMSR